MSYSENNTYEKILDRCLANDVLVNVDKRVGSIIYDTLAPVCLELAEAYAKMDILEEQTYLMTATGSNLNKRVYDYGIKRQEATQALRIGEFKCYQTDNQGKIIYDENDNPILIDMEIPEGSRFAVPEDETVTFEYVGETDGHKILQCEQAGTKGNEHTGTILPLVPINGLVEANVISTYKPAEDTETDEELRLRTINHLNQLSFGGNISDYIEKVNTIDGVGNLKVFPAWQRNGSVLLSVVDPLFNPITQEFAENLKEQIDPEEFSGQGIGIAPIGHYVTITTPVEETVDVTLTVSIDENAVSGEITTEIKEVLQIYINSIRRQFAQDVTLAIYRARIIERILDAVSDVLNVTDVLLNNLDSDIIYSDEGLLGHQYLPKLGQVVVNYE